MKHLDTIAKLIVIIAVIWLFVYVVTGCAYVNGPGTATINIDRNVEIDSTIKKEGNKK